MSFLVRNSRFAARPIIAQRVVPSRTFTTSSVRALKEDDRRMYLTSMLPIEAYTDQFFMG
jgi:hypothetical protein